MEELEAGLLTECCDLLNTISAYPENKKCFDCCDNYSPRYLCTTFSTFVCSCCANIHHKDFGHTIKVLSIFSFTVNEIYVLKETGNRVAADKWLARWRSDMFSEPDPTSATYKEDARKYMKAKYIQKRWVKLPPPLPGISELEGDPRGYEDVSPRKASDGPLPVEPSTVVSQQHEEKTNTQPVLRDTYTAPIMYMPQPMYIPVNMPPGTLPQMGLPPMGMNVPQYAYTQYRMAQPDGANQPAYYPIYNYPTYEASPHCLPPPIIPPEGTPSWPSYIKPKKKRPTTTSMHPQRELTTPQPFSAAEELPAAPPGAILRSVSDNSIVTTYVLQIPNNKRDSMTICKDCNSVSDCPTTMCSTAESPPKPDIRLYLGGPVDPPTKASDTKIKASGKSDSKLKLTGIMNKMVGLLGKKN